MPSKNLKRIATYLEPELFAKLEELAKNDKRTLSQMIALLIEEGIENRKEKQNS